LKNPSVKLSDVAKRAGMSPATASRALRGMKVHKKHQGKAEAAAAELGYVLNEAARALRSEKTMTIGLVYFELTSLLGMELLGAITAGLEEVGYSVFVSTALSKPEQYDRLVQRFLQRRVDALVCVHGAGDGAALQGYTAAGLPIMALISKSGGYKDLPLVRPSIGGASIECIRRLRELGHTSFGIIAPPGRRLPTDDFIAAAEAVDMPHERYSILGADLDAKAFLQTLRGQGKLPSVLVAFQAQAVKLLDAAEALSIRVPQDLSIVAIRDRTILPPSVKLPLSLVHIDPPPMGKAAAEAIRAWLVDGQPLIGDRDIEIGIWMERDTTGPAA
jgi:LacI family transcriptional regulator